MTPHHVKEAARLLREIEDLQSNRNKLGAVRPQDKDHVLLSLRDQFQQELKHAPASFEMFLRGSDCRWVVDGLLAVLDSRIAGLKGRVRDLGVSL